MTSHLDAAGFAVGLQREALPALNAPAQHDGQSLDRSRRRLDHDESSPDYWSTEPDTHEEIEDPTIPREQTVDSQAVSEILDKPLTEDELDELFHTLCDKNKISLGNRYVEEADVEESKMGQAIRSPGFNFGTTKLLIQKEGIRRCHVIIRHYIKKRWQRLGLWRPKWGIPDRNNVQKDDDPHEWTWEGHEEYHVTDANHPIRRAVRLRQGLKRGEASPLPPRNNLTKDSSKCEAEAFFISRPFFIFSLEVREELMRMLRLPDWEFDFQEVENTIIERWKQRGDWREEWNMLNGRLVIGWKWRHETTEPDVIDWFELNNLAAVDWTPSELDEFEDIEESIKDKKLEWQEEAKKPASGFRPLPPPDFGLVVSALKAKLAQNAEGSSSKPEQVQSETPAPTTQAITRRGRGRPRGSANKPKPSSSGNAPARRSSRIASLETQHAENPGAETKKGRPKASTDGVTAKQSATGRNIRAAATSNMITAAKPQGVVKRNASGRKPAASIAAGLSDATPKRERSQKTVAAATGVDDTAILAQDVTPKSGGLRKVVSVGVQTDQKGVFGPRRQ